MTIGTPLFWLILLGETLLFSLLVLGVLWFGFRQERPQTVHRVHLVGDTAELGPCLLCGETMPRSYTGSAVTFLAMRPPLLPCRELQGRVLSIRRRGAA